MKENKITSLDVTGDPVNGYRDPQTDFSKGEWSKGHREASGAGPRPMEAVLHEALSCRSRKSSGQQQLNVAKAMAGSCSTKLAGGSLPGCFTRGHGGHWLDPRPPRRLLPRAEESAQSPACSESLALGQTCDHHLACC